MTWLVAASQRGHLHSTGNCQLIGGNARHDVGPFGAARMRGTQPGRCRPRVIAVAVADRIGGLLTESGENDELIAMGGERLERAPVTASGIAGDRIWGLVDAATATAPTPPTMATPRGRLSSEPTPEPRARGSAPRRAAMVVIMIGRKRSRHAW